MKRILFLAIFMLLQIGMIMSQNTKYTLSGQITDGTNGEDLISATVYISSVKQGTASNFYGFYSITLDAGTYEIVYSYIGYEDKMITIDLTQNVLQNIELALRSNVLDDIVISSKEKDHHITDVDMGKITVNVDAVKKMPALFGEVDIIKAIQILPGIKTIGEATSGFYVRGGNADQNLVLLDEAPIYNASHLLGFFSSFNPDAIKDMQIYKGSIPSLYGGRLSSVLDIRMREGNSKRFGGAFGIGTMMSRLTLEAPLSSNGSFMISGRRSYLEPLIAIANSVSKKESNKIVFYFYDLNLKANYKIGKKDRIFASGYIGRDVIKFPKENFDMNWGNSTATLRWNHVFSPKLFFNLTAYYSNYDYKLGIDDVGSNVVWKSRLREWSLKADVSYFANPNNTIKFGLQSIDHRIQPGDIQIINNDNEGDNDNYLIQKNRSIENAVYISNKQIVNDKWSLNYGLRLSSLSNVGPQTVYDLDKDYNVVDTSYFASGEYNSYANLEPRLGLRYKINGSNSIKAAYNRTVQYIQQASNGNTSTPLDIWFTSSKQVEPQKADQFSIGYFKNFKDNTWETSLELYYKDFKNAVDFKERARLLLNKNLEGELRKGKAVAYGVELMIKKNKGKLTGQIGYTYSKVKKKIETVNNDNWYNAKYDQPHNFSLIASYEITDRLFVSGNFVYNTGNAVTYPTGRYVFEGTVIPVYSDRNGSRLPNYHRLDFSATLKAKKKLFGIFTTEWVFGIYNVYNRKNAYSVNFKPEDNNPNITYAEKTSVFGIVPSFTFNAKF